ncbi:MAG: DUF1573 domain-containing protein [Bacteroidetes bacterium]|nr:MAG: DUF1573 domain-containing protein [Bacteroidota bacterium]
MNKIKNILKGGLPLLFLGLLTACSGSSELEIGQKTTCEVQKVYQAGTVLLGEEVKAKFNIENTGDYPLIISEVKGSCSCTVTDYPKEPIAPGKSGTINAFVKTENASVGKLVKEVRIVSNTEPSVTAVRIEAEVVRK